MQPSKYFNLVSLALAVSATPSGSGPDYASSCQAALWSWSARSQEYGTAHPRTSTVSSELTASYPSTVLTGHISAKDFVTLCDGHPRVVGTATFQAKTTSVSTISVRQTMTTQGSAYPTPAPCSINPSDCAVLWSSFYKEFENTIYTGRNGASPAPPCATTGTANPLTADTCTAAYLMGTEARLLYWPVRTISNEENEEIFCNQTALKNPVGGGTRLPATITGTPTASGPNTFVTGSITITSPTVGIYMAGLQRVDGCGTTLSNTVVLAPPEQVSSARGQNAAYNSLAFNFADLNWKCEDKNKNGTFTIQDTSGSNCYQDVPADAYFGGMDKWKGVYYRYTSLSTSLIIANDYRPAIYPPRTFLETASRIWGPDVQWLVEGIWDPPIALLQVGTEQLPTGLSGEAIPSAPQTTSTGLLTTPYMPEMTPPAHGSSIAISTPLPTGTPGPQEDNSVSSISRPGSSPSPQQSEDAESLNASVPSSESSAATADASMASQMTAYASGFVPNPSTPSDALGAQEPTSTQSSRESGNSQLASVPSGTEASISAQSSSSSSIGIRLSPAFRLGMTAGAVGLLLL